MTDYQTQLLAQFAERLGTTAEHLWRVLIVQARVEVFVDLIYLGLAGAALYGMFRLHRKVWDTENDWVVVIVIGWVAAAIFALVTVICSSEIPGLIINPEYWALKEVLHAARKP